MPDSWAVMSVRQFRLGNCKLDEINPILCMKACSRTRKNGLQQNYFCFPHSWEVEVKLWYEVIHMRHPLLPFFLILVLNISVLFSCHIFSMHLFLQFVCRGPQKPKTIFFYACARFEKSQGWFNFSCSTICNNKAEDYAHKLFRSSPATNFLPQLHTEISHSLASDNS